MHDAPATAADDFNARARRFIDLHRQVPALAMIRNVGAQVEDIQVGGYALPVTVNRIDAGDAWICSPVTSYCDYAGEELERLDKPALAAALRPVIAAAGRGMRRARLDACVAVNNWLVATNGYPDVADDSIRTLVETAKTRWPERALWFRSLNHVHGGRWLQALEKLGATLVPSRQVYLFHDIDALERRHADMRRDLKRLRASAMRPLAPGALDIADYARAAELYGLLYLGKYSRLNPDYTPALIQAWHHAGLLDLHGLRGDDGRLAAITGLFCFGDLITAPLVGYDTARPQREGLFRLLTACVFEQARLQRRPLNLSAGVAHFKRQRGGEAVIEYSAVVADHLPLRSRIAIGMLGVATRRIGVPIMRRYRL